MTEYQKLMTQVRAGARILIDGATGPDIERRGVPQLDNAWTGGGALSHPDGLRAIHEGYVAAGAEIVISNTFATHLHAREDAGEADRFEDYNVRSVQLAREAVTKNNRSGVLVAGGMSYWSWSGRLTMADEIGKPAVRQAKFMAHAGLIWSL